MVLQDKYLYIARRSHDETAGLYQANKFDVSEPLAVDQFQHVTAQSGGRIDVKDVPLYIKSPSQRTKWNCN